LLQDGRGTLAQSLGPASFMLHCIAADCPHRAINDDAGYAQVTSMQKAAEKERGAGGGPG